MIGMGWVEFDQCGWRCIKLISYCLELVWMNLIDFFFGDDIQQHTVTTVLLMPAVVRNTKLDYKPLVPFRTER